MPKRGLIVGRFVPPHRGHKYLIDAGRAQVDQLTVIVCWRPNEAPAGEQRAEWLREIHPDVTVLLLDDTEDEQAYAVWAEHSIQVLGFVPDVLFSSEDYGEPFARCLGCAHVLVDKARRAVPVSGTMVRSAPLKYWEFLEPPVRAWYALRVCLVGAESTGKTTLAQALAERYETVWVREYGREYSALKMARGSTDWVEDEFRFIAETQCVLENAMARQANKVLFCDTDAFATSIWYRRYFQERSAEVEAVVARQKRPDLYLVTDVDVPFVADEIRDGEQIRSWMHATFLDELGKTGRRFAVLSGAEWERIARAEELIDELMAEKMAPAFDKKSC